MKYNVQPNEQENSGKQLSGCGLGGRASFADEILEI